MPVIVVNGIKKAVNCPYIQYPDLLDLAWPDNTLRYTDCPHIDVSYVMPNGDKGTIVTGEVAELTEGQSFRIVNTNQYAAIP